MSAVSGCRSCGSAELEPVLSLGQMPLVNTLLTKEQLGQPEPTYPLDLVFCPSCSLVQITETVPPEQLFREYAYFSSYSDTLLAHQKALATRMIAERRLAKDNLVVEVACNDGYLLQYYREAGVSVLGVEPARNVAQAAREKRGIYVITEFFNAPFARWMASAGYRADVLHAHNVLAHVADLNGFVGGLRTALKDDGVVVIEVHYVKDLVDNCEFDTIYHEHLCYFSLATLCQLCAEHGLMVRDVERFPLQGGSLRLYVVRKERSSLPHTSVGDLLSEETKRSVGQMEFYRDFADRVESLRRGLLALLNERKAAGKRIAAYGAAAKGAVLLNYCGIGRETLDFVVDHSPVKQGRYMPGVHVPICSQERLLAEMPDYTLLLAWNLADEILAREAEYRRRGGRFIIPLPRLREV